MCEQVWIGGEKRRKKGETICKDERNEYKTTVRPWMLSGLDTVAVRKRQEAGSLCWRQETQTRTSFRTSSKEDHQNCCRCIAHVCRTLGWQASHDSWPHSNSLALRFAGMKSRLFGHELGPGCVAAATRTLSSTSRVVQGPGRWPWREEGG